MISVTILTRNSARLLRRALGALRVFDEVLVLDTGSSDDTVAIARESPNARVHACAFTGFGPLHNQAAALARNDWILSLDSDEVMTPELSREITGLVLDERCVYSIDRRNFYNGKWIRRCGWHPDRLVRLYHKKKTCFTNAPVHERIVSEGLRKVALRGPVLHYSFTCVADFLSKTQSYSDLFAQQYQGVKSASAAGAVGHGLAAFVKFCVLKGGFLSGREGILISTSNAVSAFYKYMKLREANQRLRSDAAYPHVPSRR